MRKVRGGSKKVKQTGKKAKNWIQRAIKHPGRVKRFLRKLYGDKAFTKSGEIKQSYLLKAISYVKKNYPPGKKRKSLLNALQLAKRLETMGRGKRGK